jgi:hypothetical protein
MGLRNQERLRWRRPTSVAALIFVCVLAGVRCGHPAVPVNARVSLTDPDLATGTAATYTCDEGYELFG